MVEVVLYSTGCPRCEVIKKKLAEKGVSYTECTSVEKMLQMGMSSVPMLEINGDLLSFQEALDWIRRK